MTWRINLRVGFLALLYCLLLAVTLTGCGTGPAEHVWLNAPGWSRAQLVGYTVVTDPVPVAVDDAGRVYLLLMQRESNDVTRLRIKAMDRHAALVWDRTYEVPVEQPDQPILRWDGSRLQMFWLDAHRLYTVPVRPDDGALVGTPVLLSGQHRVQTYDVARDAGGGMTVWYAGSRYEPAVYALPPGDLTGRVPAELVDPEGIRPDIQYDERGVLHTTWAHYQYGDTQFFYAAYPGGTFRPDRARSVHKLPDAFTSTMLGPHLGLDQQNAYVFWTIFIQSGLQAGTIETNYVSLPTDAPVPASVQRLTVPYAYELPYESAASAPLHAGARVALGADGGAGAVSEVTANTGTTRELALVFRAPVAYRLNQERWQIGVAFFREGRPHGYQLLSFTPDASKSPGIVSDDDGYLYVTWQESSRPDGFPVYFASTSSDMRAGLSEITRDDVSRIAGETLFSLAFGVLLIPYVVAWMIAPLLVLGVTSPLRNEDERLTNPRELISLILVLGAYWGSKLLFLPGLVDYVPFSAWIPNMPVWLHVPLQLLVPLAIAGVGGIAAWHYTYNRDTPSVLHFFFVYAAVDGVLTMAIYGGLVVGAF